jgi:Tricorn protease C1 domain
LIISLTQIERVLVAMLCCAFAVWGATGAAAEQQKADIASFELVWETLRDQYWDRSMAGLDWQAIHALYLRQVQATHSTTEARSVITRMLHLLPSSHLAIIPGEIYRGADTKHDLSASSQKTKAGQAPADDTGDDSGSTGLTIGVINNRVIVEAVEAGSPSAKSNTVQLSV